MLCWLSALLVAQMSTAQTPGAAEASPDGAASAQPETEAERHFRAGKDLYDRGDYDAALVELKVSEDLEPTVRSIGLLAACYEKMGKLASAYRAYRVAADRARASADEREDFARDRALGLEPKLAGITLAAETPPPEMSATIDGAPVAVQSLWYVDAGEHEVVAQAPGHVPFRAAINIEDGARQVVTIPPLALVETEATPIVIEKVREAPSSTQAWVGWTGVGLGAVGLGLGGVFTGIALDQKSSLEEDPACPDACTDAGAVDDYNTMRMVTTATLVAGSVFLAAGVTLLLTAPDDETQASASVSLAPSSDGVLTRWVVRY